MNTISQQTISVVIIKNHGIDTGNSANSMILLL